MYMGQNASETHRLQPLALRALFSPETHHLCVEKMSFEQVSDMLKKKKPDSWPEVFSTDEKNVTITVTEGIHPQTL